MDLELQIQMKNDPVDINIVTAKNSKDLQEIVDQLVQDCKHIENVKISDMEEFATSLRGKFVMNEVIQYGLTVMESLPDRERPDSDIQDIKRIRDTIFKWK
tara:strand:- start:95 stop:397 length:303 start_codon:yes stop_codon:yes gene_type:complete